MILYLLRVLKRFDDHSCCIICCSMISSHSKPQFLHLVICDERNPAHPQLTTAVPSSTSCFISGITSAFAGTTLTSFSDPHLKHFLARSSPPLLTFCFFRYPPHHDLAYHPEEYIWIIHENSMLCSDFSEFS